ncbi:MAG: hypothetical protein ACRCSK_05285 [Fusobacteriaceae bacterium]
MLRGKLKESKKYLFEIIIAIVIIFGAISYGFYSKAKDLRNTTKVEKTFEKLERLRVALEKYYQLTGTYPELSMEDANDNLHLLDVKDQNGNVISFAKIYGRNSIEDTESILGGRGNNKVYDTSKFDEGSGTGGWNYDYSGRTGEIHANINSGEYGSVDIDWSEE